MTTESASASSSTRNMSVSHFCNVASAASYFGSKPSSDSLHDALSPLSSVSLSISAVCSGSGSSLLLMSLPSPM